jgi:hypothetical protein
VVGEKLLQLARNIVDEDRKINKQLRDDANTATAYLYDKIYVVVEKTAQLNGFQAVLAYPDGVTPEERNKPYIKELKLKPPALQPFEIDPRVELTAVIVKTLNAWYPPLDKDGKLVDVAKLDIPPLHMPPPAPGAPALLEFERPPGAPLPPPPSSPTTPSVKLPPLPVPAGSARPPSEPPSRPLPSIPVVPIPMKR